MKSKNTSLSAYIILIWILLLTIVIVQDGIGTQDLSKGSFAIWAGVYSIYIGIVIVASYYSQETFILRWISWFITHITFRLGGDKMLVFWGGLAIFLGVVGILVGIGIV